VPSNYYDDESFRAATKGEKGRLVVATNTFIAALLAR
jgi:hypothetical protein